MRMEIPDKTEPKKILTVKGGATRGNIVVQIDGVSREVDARDVIKAVNVARNSPTES